ncbi:hypothetical protein GGI05_000792 [Coemansia sp. RSA 2603]|nr:hypothetical protein GGI05_000792 [Coemansia sp. RSA 2603]
MVYKLGYISVQPDWTTDVKNALNSADGTHKFWVSAYKLGSSSIHDNIQATKHTGPDGSTKLVELKSLSTQDISAEYIDVRHIRLSSSKLDIPPTVHTAARKTVPCEHILRGTGIRSFDVSPYGGLLVACGDDGVMDVYDISAARHRVKLEGHLGDVTCCQFFPSGQVVLSGATDMRVKVWSASDGSNPVTLVGHTAAITDTAIVGKGRNVLSAAKDGTVRLWHCGSSSLVHTFALSKLPINKIDVISTLPEASSLEEDPDAREFETQGKVLVACYEDGRAVLVDLESKETIAEFGSTGGQPVRAAAYDVPNCRIYVGLSDGTVQVWSTNAPSDQPVYSFKRNESAVSAIRLVNPSTGTVPLACIGTEDGQLFLTSLDPFSSHAADNVNVVEELVGFDVDPISQIRVVQSATQGAIRQSVWAAGRDNKVYEF